VKDLKLMSEYSDLLPQERIAKYRTMAANARESADNAAAAEVKDAYTAIAMTWEAMAIEFERAHDGLMVSREPAHRVGAVHR
jgi:hypothetical protein